MKIFFKPGPNWLLIFIPISFALEAAHASEPLIFFSAALSIIPIAKLIVHSTVQPATLISGNDRYSWFKGIQLIVIYIFIDLTFFFIPDAF
jgi:Ca2+/H+ antiporter